MVFLPIVGICCGVSVTCSATGALITESCDDQPPKGSLGRKIADFGNIPRMAIVERYRNVELKGHERVAIVAKTSLCRVVMGFGNVVYKVERLFKQKDLLEKDLREWNQQLARLAEHEQVDAKLVEEFRGAITKSHHLVDTAQKCVQKLKDDEHWFGAKIKALNDLLDEIDTKIVAIREKIAKRLPEEVEVQERVLHLLATIRQIPVEELVDRAKMSLQQITTKIMDHVPAIPKQNTITLAVHVTGILVS